MIGVVLYVLYLLNKTSRNLLHLLKIYLFNLTIIKYLKNGLKNKYRNRECSMVSE